MQILEHLSNQNVIINQELTIVPSKLDSYIVPTFEQLRKQIADYFCPLLFSSLGIHGFYEVLSNIFMERSVVFVSENLNVLTSSVYLYFFTVVWHAALLFIHLNGSTP